MEAVSAITSKISRSSSVNRAVEMRVHATWRSALPGTSWARWFRRSGPTWPILGQVGLGGLAAWISWRPIMWRAGSSRTSRQRLPCPRWMRVCPLVSSDAIKFRSNISANSIIYYIFRRQLLALWTQPLLDGLELLLQYPFDVLCYTAIHEPAFMLHQKQQRACHSRFSCSGQLASILSPGLSNVTKADSRISLATFSRIEINPHAHKVDGGRELRPLLRGCSDRLPFFFRLALLPFLPSPRRVLRRV
jgi:hypothetical protein